MIAPRPCLLSTLILLVLAACGEPEPGVQSAAQSGPDAAVTSASKLSGSAQLELLTFSKLQGRAEAMPCNPGSASPLASAARTKAALASQGDALVRLICVGDSLRQTATITSTKAARAGARARDDVILDAMAAAGVDMYVPAFGDFANGVVDLLDRCAARGLPVVISNLEVDGRDDVLPYLIFEHNGLRVAALAGIPSDEPRGKPEVAEPGVTIAKPVRRLKALSEDLLERDQADIVVVFSAMPGRINNRLCDVPSVHFIIGTTDRGMAAGRVVHRHGTSMMNQEFNGLELGHTSIRVVDGDLRMADLSGLYYLPEQIVAEEAALDAFERQYGTRELTQLARYLSPGREQEFLDKYTLVDQNRQWLKDFADYPGSFVSHRVAPFESDPGDDPVRAILAGQAGAIQHAVAQIEAEPSDVDPFSHIGKPETCNECHQAQYDHWRGTGHSRAYDLLVEVGRQNDTSCLVCHAAGYAAPGGFTDPRVGAPFGGHTCWNCHATESYHAELLRGATDPAFIGIRQAEPMMEYCQNCHSEQRSPGFDLKRAMERVTCPTTRFDDPTLSTVRSKVLAAIERQRENGTDEPRDRYREGRALVGLGRVTEGIAALREFLDGIKPSDQGYMPQHIEVARFLDDLGRSAEGIELLRSLLAGNPADPGLHLTYIELLLDAQDPEARDPGWAASYLDLKAPIEPGKRFDGEELPMRLLQVRALFESGRQQEGYQLLQGLNASFARNDDIQDLMSRYLSQPR